jgi:hypothetical protein
MSNRMLSNPFDIEKVLDYVIALFPEEEDTGSVSAHTHNESKLDQAIRLIEGGCKT